MTNCINRRNEQQTLVSPTVTMASCQSPVLVGVECCHHPQEAATAFLVWNMTRLRTQLAKFLLSKTACSQETTMKASLIGAAQHFHTKANQRRRKLTCIQFREATKERKKKRGKTWRNRWKGKFVWQVTAGRRLTQLGLFVVQFIYTAPQQHEIWAQICSGLPCTDLVTGSFSPWAHGY